MKTKIVLAALSVIILLGACKKIDELLTFTVNDQTEIVIESSAPFSLPVEIPTPDITTNSDEEFSNNGTRSDLVKEVYLSNLVLSIKSPEDKTFSFLKSIHIYIRTNDSDEVELAYKDNVNSDAKFINLDLTHERLDKYIKADSYKLRTEVTTKETLTQDVTIVVDMSFKVTADPL